MIQNIKFVVSESTFSQNFTSKQNYQKRYKVVDKVFPLEIYFAQDNCIF